MYAIPHTLTGIAIASKTDNIPLIIILSIISHYFLDWTPHWNALPQKRPISTFINKWLLQPIFKKEVINEKRGLKDVHDLLFVMEPVFAFALLVLFLYYSSIQPAILLLAVFSSLLPDILIYINYRYRGQFKFFKILHDFHTKIQNHTKSMFWGLLTQAATIVAALMVIKYL